MGRTACLPARPTLTPTQPPTVDFFCASSTAFPQTVTLPNSLSESISWISCNVTLPNSTKDVNGNKTTYSYDSMFRLTGIGYPDGGSLGITYTNPNETDLETAVTTSASRHDQLDLDGQGRVQTSALVNDPDGETYVATTYDALGRALTVSNPYRTLLSGRGHLHLRCPEPGNRGYPR